MPVKHAILGILKEAPRHGYELKNIFDERIGNFWNLNYGQIYTTLDRLEKEGLVSGSEEEQNSRPDKKVYDISLKGIQKLESWLQEPTTKPRALRDELFIKLVFISKENPKLALQLIERQTHIYMEQIRELTETKYRLTKDGISPKNIMTDLLTDAALFHAEADVRWLGHVEVKIVEFARS